MNLTDLGITELQAKLRSKEISSVELTRAYLERIAATDDSINAFITVCEDEAITDAEEADKQIVVSPNGVITIGSTFSGMPKAL